MKATTLAILGTMVLLIYGIVLISGGKAPTWAYEVFIMFASVYAIWGCGAFVKAKHDLADREERVSKYKETYELAVNNYKDLVSLHEARHDCEAEINEILRDRVHKLDRIMRSTNHVIIVWRHRLDVMLTAVLENGKDPLPYLQSIYTSKCTELDGIVEHVTWEEIQGMSEEDKLINRNAEMPKDWVSRRQFPLPKRDCVISIQVEGEVRVCDWSPCLRDNGTGLLGTARCLNSGIGFHAWKQNKSEFEMWKA